MAKTRVYYNYLRRGGVAGGSACAAAGNTEPHSDLPSGHSDYPPGAHGARSLPSYAAWVTWKDKI